MPARRDRLDLDDAVREVLTGLATTIDAAAQANSLAAKLLAITIPGVPDVYQGSELWEQSLVDPDNRRPVDFDSRASLLAGLTEARVLLRHGLVRAEDAVHAFDRGLAEATVAERRAATKSAIRVRE